MPPRRKAPEDSPDPLLIFDIIEPIGTSDEIVADRPTQPEPPTKRPRTSTRITAKSPVSSPSRSILTPAKPQTQTKTRTPLSKSHVSKPTPVRSTKETPRKTPAAPPTLGSSTKATLPTPSRSRPQTQPKSSVKGKEKENVRTPTKRKNEDIFANSSPSKADAAISRETFLANEALKRQREARNFKYKGDANAPRQTRSGRVVVDLTEGDEVDEFGGEEKAELVDEEEEIVEVVEEVPVGDEEIRILDESGLAASYEQQPISEINPLSEFARQHITNILSTITSQHVSTDPPPFQDEDQNEALQGLLKLLQGTVDRGEGNSAMVTGPRGAGKTRTVARAIKLLSANTDSGSTSAKSKTAPIVVKLSGHLQTNDRLAIREMGRQIAVAEGTKPVEDEGQEDDTEGNDGEEYAPTTLPSHLLALLTAPSPRAIIIVIEEFDLFTEHARQALLYCLLDVVQSIKTGPVETTGRGVAVIGITSRIDTLLLLEKRVKSRFSHRQWRITSPLSPESIGWAVLLRQSLVPWSSAKSTKDSKEDRKWKGDWEYAVDTLLEHSKIKKALDRLSGLTTDVRNLYKPFVVPLSEILGSKLDFMSIPQLAENVLVQIELAGWGTSSSKLKGLPHPALGILIIAKHLYYAGREEFNLAQVEEEYLRFARTKLVGIGKTRWPLGLLRTCFDHMVRVSILTPASNSSAQPRFAKVRCTLSPHEIVAWFKGEGGSMLGPELTTWGRVMGGHA